MGKYTICPKTGLKKGVWSVEEDRLLTDYITRYGHWNWRELPKYAGLSRCGKSCRLRWMNYLRPNIKRGNFTREEEELIINLHERLGNRWSVIAASLPGRTDNEIKNHWHTHLKKKTEPRGKGANQKVRKCKSLAELIMPDFVHSNNVAHLVYENSDAILINVTPTTTEIEERQESRGSELSQWWDGWTQQTDMDILDCYQPSHDAKSSGFSSFICDSCESTGIKGESEISILDNVGDLLHEPFFAENSPKPDENTSVIAEPSHQFVVPPLDDMCTVYDLDMFFN